MGQNAAGSLDATFGAGGKVVSPIGTSNDVAQGVAVQSDGKIVVVGTAFTPTKIFPVVRYNTNGTLDASFGNNGVVALQIGSIASGDSYAVAIQPNGKIVLAGETRDSNGASDFALVRYNDGTKDATADFNGDGKTDWAIIRGTTPGSQMTWFTRNSGEENLQATQWGIASTDSLSPVDYDGDGKDDVAVRRSNGFFYILNSATGTFRAVFVGGVTGNHPVSADYDGDGKDDPAIYVLPTAAQGPGSCCYVASLNNPSQQVTCVQWGMRYGSQVGQEDDPYPGDFDGDGKADFVV